MGEHVIRGRSGLFFLFLSYLFPIFLSYIFSFGNFKSYTTKGLMEDHVCTKCNEKALMR